MPKKNKLKLDDLKVKSFVTQLDGEAHKVKGGDETELTICIFGSCYECSVMICPTDPQINCN